MTGGVVKQFVFHDKGDVLMDKDIVRNDRQTAHLERLAQGGGKPVRVDTHGPDLNKLDALVSAGFAPSRAEAYRRALRMAHQQHLGG